MKLLYYFALLAATANNCNCSKQVNRPAGFTTNKTVAVNTCSPFVQNGTGYTICLDSVANESRCPSGAECIWAGYARGKFTFTAGTAVHHFYLHTGAVAHSGGPFPKDTIFNNIRIKFINLTPYPAVNTASVYSDYKAEVMITPL